MNRPVTIVDDIKAIALCYVAGACDTVSIALVMAAVRLHRTREACGAELREYVEATND